MAGHSFGVLWAAHKKIHCSVAVICVHVDGKHCVCSLTASPFNSMQNCLKGKVVWRSWLQCSCSCLHTLNARTSRHPHPARRALKELIPHSMAPCGSTVECIAAPPKCYPFPRTAHPAIHRTPESGKISMRNAKGKISLCFFAKPRIFCFSNFRRISAISDATSSLTGLSN